MDSVQARLQSCFETVFPGIPEDEIPQSSQLTIPKWDSVGVITLANVIEEEFEFQVDFDRLPELNSFELMLAYIRDELDK